MLYNVEKIMYSCFFIEKRKERKREIAGERERERGAIMYERECDI